MEKVQNVNTSGPELSDLENESTGVRKETHAHLVSLFHKIIYKTTKNETCSSNGAICSCKNMTDIY